MKSVWIITAKDLRLLLGDTRAAVLLILLPLIFIAVIGLSTGQMLSGDKDNTVDRVVVVDLCQSELSQQFVQQLGQLAGIQLGIEQQAATAEMRMQRNEADVVVVIGPEFENRVDELRLADLLDQHRPPLNAGPQAIDLEVVVTPNYVGKAELVRTVLFVDALRSISPYVASKNAIARQWLADRQNQADEDGTDAGPDPAPHGAQAGDHAAAGEASPGGSKRLEPLDTTGVFRVLVPGYTVMFMFFLVNVMARSFLVERDLGTLRRLRLAPIRPWELLLGKTLPFYVISVWQGLLLFLGGRLLFGMSWGTQPLTLVPMILCTSLAATALGLLLATIVQTDQQVSAYGTAVVILMASISGCFLPRRWLPPLMQDLSLATPHAWSLIGFDAALRSADWVVVGRSCGVLLAFAAVFFLTGVWRFSRTRA